MKPAWLHWCRFAAQPWLLAPVLVLGIYLVSMPRAVTFEDDGLFLMAATYAGLPQPPGYPLYVLAGHVASLIPFGTVPVRLHALSALFGATACVFVALIGLRLTGSNAIAFVSAAAFGLSRTFWSQSIIAEVYAPNACLVLGLFWLGLRAVPDPAPAHGGPVRNAWGGFALVYGLALSLHWPLVLLSTPALAVLAWSARPQIGRGSAPLALFLAGLVPYAWMVWRSQSGVFINFYGPLESLREFWYFVSREGYTEVDVSATSGLEDTLRFALFLGSEMSAQFTPVGFALAAVGFVAQWRQWPGAAGTALTLLFLGNTAPFLLLLHFDYDDLTRAVFAVYPHLAWAAMAVWLGLGIHVSATALMHVARRRASAPALTWTLGGIVALLAFAQNFQTNDRRGFTAADDYGRRVLLNLPADAELFVSGDVATHTLGYLRYVEGVRSDVAVYSLEGLVFANRLFKPLETSAEDELRLIEQHVQGSPNPICTTTTLAAQVPHVDSWLFQCMAREASAPAYEVSLNADLLAYLERVTAAGPHADPWTAFHHGQLIRRAGALVGKAESMDVAGERVRLARTKEGFYGVLGYLEGLTFFSSGKPSLRNMVEAINRVSYLPARAPKPDRGRFLALRGFVHERMGDAALAAEEFEASLAVWPDPGNESIASLLRIYRETGNDEKLARLRLRFPEISTKD